MTKRLAILSTFFAAALLTLPLAAKPTPKNDRVIFFGDSITISWPLAQSFPGKPYQAQGGNGLTTTHLLELYQQQVLDARPAAVVILAGINDIAQNDGPAPIELTQQNLAAMAQQATARGIHVILASVLPATDFGWHPGLAPAPKIKALNQWIAAYCAKQHLTYLDYYTALAAPDGGMKPGLSHDGIHPGPEGFALMAPLAQAAIDESLSPAK